MGNKDFAIWYQEWSQHARCSNVDEETKKHCFRKNLNSQLHNKILQISPQPATLADLVKKARELDKNWRIFARNTGGTPCRNPRVQEISRQTPAAKINTTHVASEARDLTQTQETTGQNYKSLETGPQAEL